MLSLENLVNDVEPFQFHVDDDGRIVDMPIDELVDNVPINFDDGIIVESANVDVFNNCK